MKEKSCSRGFFSTYIDIWMKSEDTAIKILKFSPFLNTKVGNSYCTPQYIPPRLGALGCISLDRIIHSNILWVWVAKKLYTWGSMEDLIKVSFSNSPKWSDPGNCMSDHYKNRKGYKVLVQSVHGNKSAVLFSSMQG